MAVRHGVSRIAPKPYVLIREALAGQSRAAVTKITLSTRENLALVRAQGDILTLQTMCGRTSSVPPRASPHRAR
ncbi:hypothetical protein OG948_37100 (plasmid) [Embleya sp. NBC_00888]|uniref:hypothetical protein n=1 Tax=Embleya sp. NBC_00888 TaxID=2975960 RepID=UPI002F90B9CC|nr:hypothetical protein OG948_37100 [Embleya sp. NBC_00888]